MEKQTNQTGVSRWFPKYLHIKDSTINLDKTFILYSFDDIPKKFSRLCRINIYHCISAAIDRIRIYYSCEDDQFISIYFDGYQYFRIISYDKKIPIETYESSPKRFLDDNNYGKRLIVKDIYLEAFKDLIDSFPGSVDYTIDDTDKGYFHTEKLVYQPNRFAMWSDAGQKIDYFPKYINISNNDKHPVIFVRINIIDDKTAQYWLCSGEWGMVLSYSNKSYRMIQQTSDFVNETPVNITESTADEFVRCNGMFKLDKTKQLYLDAWETIKSENPLAKDIIFEKEHDFQYVYIEYSKNTIKNWVL